MKWSNNCRKQEEEADDGEKQPTIQAGNNETNNTVRLLGVLAEKYLPCHNDAVKKVIVSKLGLREKYLGPNQLNSRPLE